MQLSHQAKVFELRKEIETVENEKKDVGIVDDRMTEIKGSIEEILKESTGLKYSNEQLEREINQK